MATTAFEQLGRSKTFVVGFGLVSVNRFDLAFENRLSEEIELKRDLFRIRPESTTRLFKRFILLNEKRDHLNFIFDIDSFFLIKNNTK